MLRFHLSSKQVGSTLLVGMIMLILLTLLAVSAIQSTTSNLQVVGNAQFREEATAAAQQAIENVISNPVFTTAPTEQTIDINRDGVTDYSVVFFPAPTCKSYKVLDTAVDPVIPEDCIGLPGLCYRTTWDISALVSDVNTGTKVQLHQGVKLIVGYGAAANSCGVT